MPCGASRPFARHSQTRLRPGVFVIDRSPSETVSPSAEASGTTGSRGPVALGHRRCCQSKEGSSLDEAIWSLNSHRVQKRSGSKAASDRLRRHNRHYQSGLDISWRQVVGRRACPAADARAVAEVLNRRQNTRWRTERSAHSLSRSRHSPVSDYWGPWVVGAAITPLTGNGDRHGEAQRSQLIHLSTAAQREGLIDASTELESCALSVA